MIEGSLLWPTCWPRCIVCLVCEQKVINVMVMEDSSACDGVMHVGFKIGLTYILG